MGWKPLLHDDASHRLECLGIAEEPGLRHDNRFHQLMQFFGRTLDPFPIAVGVVYMAVAHARMHRALDRRCADRGSAQAHCLLQKMCKASEAHWLATRSPRTNACTSAGSRVSSSTRWTRPRGPMVNGVKSVGSHRSVSVAFSTISPTSAL